MRLILAALATLAAALPAAARDRAGEFDYYVMALSWSPNWCSGAGDRREAEQCDAGRRVGFVLHGLWPQYESGWPQNCRTAQRDPSRRESREMADIMGSAGLAWYQWRKHGRCTGLPAARYHALSREAFESVGMPDYFTGLDRDISIPPELIERAFIEFNPGLRPDGITVTCRGGELQEIRICLTKDLKPRDCAPDVRRDCSRDAVVMEKLR